MPATRTDKISWTDDGYTQTERRRVPDREMAERSEYEVAALDNVRIITRANSQSLKRRT